MTLCLRHFGIPGRVLTLFVRIMHSEILFYDPDYPNNIPIFIPNWFWKVEGDCIFTDYWKLITSTQIRLVSHHKDCLHNNCLLSPGNWTKNVVNQTFDGSCTGSAAGSPFVYCRTIPHHHPIYCHHHHRYWYCHYRYCGYPWYAGHAHTGHHHTRHGTG